MKNPKKYIASALAVGAIGAAVIVAPVASADTNPLVPYGPNPHTPYVLGQHVSNHDEADQSAGSLDSAF